MIVVGGLFSELAGQARNYVGRLHPDGALDEEFDPAVNNEIYTMIQQRNNFV